MFNDFFYQVTVNEYALLQAVDKPGPQRENQLDYAEISHSAFNHLCMLSESFYKNGARLFEIAGKRKLKLDNYVGVIETPCKTRIEILPKHTQKIDNAPAMRKLLIRMLEVSLHLHSRDANKASLSLFKQPLHEWIINNFLKALDSLIKLGLRLDYKSIEEEQRFLRGQLDFSFYIRQPSSRAHIFPIRHDIFSVDRPENRLLRSALEKICKITKDTSNWRLAQELRMLTNEINCSKNIDKDFEKWQSNRLLASYESIRPWCELVLGQHMPVTIQGRWHGVSLLFPMDKLFENYVVGCLKRQIKTDVLLQTQVSSKHFCTHLNEEVFKLKPDIQITHNSCKVILDTKWKKINSKNAPRYGIIDSDLQQMFAYSHFYLEHKGDILLIYPKWEGLTEAIAPFYFNYLKSENHKKPALWVVPFDLEKEQIIIHSDLRVDWLI